MPTLNYILPILLVFILGILSEILQRSKDNSYKIFSDYFEKNQGTFAALALFLVVVFSSLEINLFFSFTAYLLSFILLTYLILRIKHPVSAWMGILFFGFFIFMLALFSFGFNKYQSLFGSNNFSILSILALLIIGFISVDAFWKTIKGIFRILKKP